jgi:hypothetical protein
MGFIFRIVLAVLLFIALEFYFWKRLSSSLRTALGPSFKNKIRAGSLVFLILVNIYPLYLVLNLLLIQLTHGRPYQQPQGGFFDYLIFFPFIILTLIIVQSLFIILPLDVLRLIIFPFIKKAQGKGKTGHFMDSAWNFVCLFCVRPLKNYIRL